MELRSFNVERVYKECVTCKVGSSVGVRPEVLKERKAEIVDMLDQIEFATEQQQLRFCNVRKDGEVWTQYLQPVEMLMLLGRTIGRVAFSGPINPRTLIHLKKMRKTKHTPEPELFDEKPAEVETPQEEKRLTRREVFSTKQQPVPEDAVPADYEEVRQKVFAALVDRYGSIGAFLHSDLCMKYGGPRIKPYLYSTGSRSVDIIGGLSAELGFGRLYKKTVVVREVRYFLEKPNN